MMSLCMANVLHGSPSIVHGNSYSVLQSNYAAILSDEEVNEILNLTRSHYKSWKSIGLELGIDSAALDAIEKNYINDHRRLIAMIDLWHSSVDLKPSREAMVKALQSEKVTMTATGIHQIYSALIFP